jgi:hypothetical protein
MEPLELLNSYVGRGVVGAAIGGGIATLNNAVRPDNSIDPLLLAGVGFAGGAGSKTIPKMIRLQHINEPAVAENIWIEAKNQAQADLDDIMDGW